MDMIGMGKKENIVLQCEMFVKCMLLYQEHLLSLCGVIGITTNFSCYYMIIFS